MDKLALKKKILDAGIKKQEALINDFKERISDLMESKTSISEGTYDSGDHVRNSQAKDRVDMLTRQLNFAVEEMTKLKSINTDTTHENVHLGSVVQTEQRKFFVSVSLELFEAEGVQYFGISTKSPIFQAMAGKKKGEEFHYNETHYLIKDLY